MKKTLVCFFFFLISSSNLFANNIAASYQASFVSEAAGNYAQAISDLKGLYQKYPLGYTLNYRLGWLFYKNKAYANSEYHYKRAIKVSPESIEARLSYESLLMAQLKWEELEEISAVIVQKDRYSYLGNLRYMIALIKRQKFPEAIKIGVKMSKLYPTDMDYLFYTAAAYEGNNEKKQALKYYQALLILSPINQVAQSKVALLSN